MSDLKVATHVWIYMPIQMLVYCFVSILALMKPGSAAARLLGLWVRIPPGHGCPSLVNFASSHVEISAKGPITLPEESYRVLCV